MDLGLADSWPGSDVRKISDSKACSTRMASLYSLFLFTMHPSLNWKSRLTLSMRMTDSAGDSCVKDWMLSVRS